MTNNAEVPYSKQYSLIARKLNTYAKSDYLILAVCYLYECETESKVGMAWLTVLAFSVYSRVPSIRLGGQTTEGLFSHQLGDVMSTFSGVFLFLGILETPSWQESWPSGDDHLALVMAFFNMVPLPMTSEFYIHLLNNSCVRAQPGIIFQLTSVLLVYVLWFSKQSSFTEKKHTVS